MADEATTHVDVPLSEVGDSLSEVSLPKAPQQMQLVRRCCGVTETGGDPPRGAPPRPLAPNRVAADAELCLATHSNAASMGPRRR